MNWLVRILDHLYRVSEIKRLKNIDYGKMGGTEIGLGNRFYNSKNIFIEDFVHIGNNGRFFADARILIGSGTVISDCCEIRTANHYYDGVDLKAVPFDERVIKKPVIVEKNCWIGTRVTILSGVTLGEGCVIGAGSVVTRDIPAFSIAAGNPAKIIKNRNIEVYKKLSQENKQYIKEKEKNK